MILSASRAKPVHYDLSLYDLNFGDNWGYKGIVKIDTKITRPTTEIELNVKAIDIQSAELSSKDGSGSPKAAQISYNRESERAILKFSEELQPADVVVNISFTGTINDHMAGFSRAKYKPAATPGSDTPKDGDKCYMFSTQFEACDARQAFPCFDEPNHKASFDFEIEIPKGLVALSNMPVKGTRDGSNSSLQVVSFERTPIMSTYVSIYTENMATYSHTLTLSPNLCSCLLGLSVTSNMWNP